MTTWQDSWNEYTAYESQNKEELLNEHNWKDTRMAGLSELNGGTFFNGIEETKNAMTNEETKCEIIQLTGFSNRLEKILLALLLDQGLIKDRIEKDRIELKSCIDQVNDELLAEKDERLNGEKSLQNEIDKHKAVFDNELEKVTNDFGKEIENLKEQQASANQEINTAVDNLKKGTQENLAVLKQQIENEIKENVDNLKENISSLEDTVHEDLNKLQKDICDIDENLQEEKLLRINGETKLIDDLKLANDSFNNEMENLQNECSNNIKK